MALKIRQKKQKTPPASHPRYTANTGTHWADKYREEHNSGYRRSFIALVVVMIIIVLVLIFATINGVIDISSDEQQISASDTFAVTSYEQQQMTDTARKFADGVLVYAYCSDESAANQGKTAALQTLAQNTSTYRNIEELEKVNPVIAPENFVPVTTTPQLQDATRAYAGSFVYEFDGVAADSSITSEQNPNGTFADVGYHFTITFDYVEDQTTNENVWIITQAVITPNYNR